MDPKSELDQLLEEGRNFVEQKDYGNANKVFARALDLGSTDPIAFYGRAYSLRKLGSLGLAQTIIAAALSSYPGDLRLLLEQGKLYAAGKQYNEAIKTFDKILSFDTNYRDALSWKLDVLVEQHGLEETIRLFQKALEEQPNDIPSLNMLGYLYNRHGNSHPRWKDYILALQSFCQVLVLEPTNVLAQEGKVESESSIVEFLDSLDQKDSQSLLQEALTLSPHSAELLIAKARLLYKHQQYDEAINFLNAVLALHPGKEEAFLGIVAAFRFSSRFDEAQKALDEAAIVLPGSVKLLAKQLLLYFDKGQLHLGQKQYAMALPSFDNFISLYNSVDNVQRRDIMFEFLFNLNIDIYDLLGEVFKGKAEAFEALYGFAEAIRMQEEALLKEPKDISALNQLGWLCLHRGKYVAAIKAFSQVLSIAPDDLSASTGSTRVEEDLQDKVEEIDLKNQNDADGQLQDKASKVDPEKRNEAKALQAVLGEVVALLPESPRRIAFLKAQGELYLKSEQYKDAVDSFDRVLAVGGEDDDLLRRRSEAFLGQHGFEAATKILGDALAKDPNDIRALNGQGWIHHKQGDHIGAVTIFNDILKRLPDNTFAVKGRDEAASRLQEIINSLQLKGHLTQAEKLLAETLELLPDNVLLLNERGALYMSQGKHDRAIETFERVLTLDEANWYAPIGKIIALRYLRRFDEAIEALKELTDKRGEDYFILQEHGWIALSRNELDEAGTYFSKAIEAAGEITERTLYLKLNQVEVLVRKNDSDAALQIAETLKTDFPDSLDVRNSLGWIYIHRNSLNKAEDEFRSILKKDQSHQAGIVGLGAVYFAQGRYEDATAEFRQALLEMPNDPASLTNLAWALTGQLSRQTRQEKKRKSTKEAKQDNKGEPIEEAQRLCKQALGHDPHYAQAYGCLGVIAFKQGRVRDSEEYFLKSIEVSSDRKENGSYTDLGALYLQLAKDDDAEKRLLEGISYNKYDTQAYVALGDLSLRRGEVQEAIRYFKRAQAIDPTNEDAPRGLALSLMQKGEFSEAGDVLKTALRTLDEAKRPSLHLTLSQLYTQLGNKDKEIERQYYEEALQEVSKALRLKQKGAFELYFQRGIIKSQLEDYRGAKKDFQECLAENEDHFEANMRAKRIEQYLREDQRARLVSTHLSMGLALTSLLLLILLWLLYFFTDKVTETMLTVFTPVLLGLVFLAIILPGLIKVKLPGGIEADLTEKKKETISPGPKGDIGFNSAAQSLISGPGAN